ncbi:hypothetical protein FJV76_17505 [Mesorhizobium sp. WSM4303]|uniref:Imm45 family immunity protein n=1 Tax=unclassified Mesorhizobium TaxID=325217 RepID=UPI00115D98FE|nr:MULTISPECIES: Imm45 family immunity protein [unclassified Mesorhizobium]TRC95104.1 hypothetical protein FJV77_16790 [Mesorhizobium sp. WSM4306]TRD03076.1 hypothetical protein FJV76_17505 [Mesorhizobium sp. WSM4303]
MDIPKMTWTRLDHLKDDPPLFRGSLFRYRKMASIEEVIDYMLFETHEASGLGLVRDSGYGAGNVLVFLPAEAKVPGKVVAISPEWLRHNWQNCVDSESTPDQVWVCLAGRPAPDKLPEE